MPGIVAVEVRYHHSPSPRGVILARSGFKPMGKGATGFEGAPDFDDRLASIYESDLLSDSFGVLRPTDYWEDWLFCVPPGCAASWRAGEDWRPVVDYLLEIYPDRLAWLAELVANLEESP